MKPFLRSFIFTLLIIVVVIVSFTSGYLLRGSDDNRQHHFPILTQAYDILISHSYFSPPADPNLEYGMIRGMVAAYGDPYTSFAEPVQHELETNTLQGVFGGIGVKLDRDSFGYYILYPYPDSPAANAGILDGDRLVQVDDLLVLLETSPEDVQATISGPVGEKVQVKISRPPDFVEYVFTITRRETPLPSVTWHIEPTEARLGIVQVNIIAATTREEIIKAIADLQSRGATVFVLDLRNNSGGLLDAGIEISRLFLESGVIIEQQYRGQPVETFSVAHPGELSKIPLAIFINHNTASAAEIIAGSLQVNHRAIIIGAPSYGKDTIQLVFDLNDGSSLHITAATWWIPGLAAPLASHGLPPDILIDPTIEGASDPFIDAAVAYLLTDR